MVYSEIVAAQTKFSGMRMHLLGGVVAIKVEKPICIPSVVAACPEKADTRKTNFHTTTAFTNIDEHWQIDRASANL